MLQIATFRSISVISDIQASITDWDMPTGIELKDYGRMRKDGELKVANHDTSAATPRLLYKNPEKMRYVFGKATTDPLSIKFEHFERNL